MWLGEHALKITIKTDELLSWVAEKQSLRGPKSLAEAIFQKN